MDKADTVVGIESSPSAVTHARALVTKNQCQGWELIQHGDAAQLPLDDERFDLMSASHVLEHLADDDAALDEWIRAVKPGGHLLILLPSNAILFPDSKHLRTCDVSGFSRRLEGKGLEQIAVDEHQRFDRPFTDYRLILASRRAKAFKLLIEAPKVALFLPAAVMSWKLLAKLDEALGTPGAKSSSIAYLFRKPALGTTARSQPTHSRKTRGPHKGHPWRRLHIHSSFRLGRTVLLSR